jgi:AAA15 family ATPase/GTPase
MLHTIKLDNLLSFASVSPALELKNLNVLIGTNGSGKSNLIESIPVLSGNTEKKWASTPA